MGQGGEGGGGVVRSQLTNLPDWKEGFIDVTQAITTRLVLYNNDKGKRNDRFTPFFLLCGGLNWAKESERPEYIQGWVRFCDPNVWNQTSYCLDITSGVGVGV